MFWYVVVLGVAFVYCLGLTGVCARAVDVVL